MSVFSDLVADNLDPVMLAEFGDEVTYTPRVGDSYTVTVVLASGEAVQQSRHVYQTAWAPITSFVAEPVKGDSIIFEGVTYRVGDIEKHHLGGRILSLSVMNPL
jgi:hypothetical protein